MNEIYTKKGATRRVVLVAGSRVELRINECGHAVSTVGHFEAAPVEGKPLAFDTDPALDRSIDDILRLAEEWQLDLRRLTALDGISEQTIEPGEKQWVERHSRVALRLENGFARSGVDLLLGAASASDLKTTSIETAAIALSRFRGDHVEPERLGLSPNITAELWTHLAGISANGVSIGQGTHHRYPLDGSGNPVEPLERHAGKWPNSYRPSYRYPPVAMPLHLTVRGESAARGSTWRAVALLDRFEIARRQKVGASEAQLRCSLLATDGISSGVVRLAMETSSWIRNLTLIPGEPEWFPYAGGSWGCEAEIEVNSTA